MLLDPNIDPDGTPPTGTQGDIEDSPTSPDEVSETPLPEADAGTPPTEPGAEPGKKSKPSAVEELIHVRKRAQEAERRNAYLEGLLQGQGRGAGSPSAPVTPHPQPAPSPDELGPRPSIESFNGDIDAYEAARDDWVAKKAVRDAVERIRQEQDSTTRRSKVERMQEAVQTAAAKDSELMDAISDPSFGFTDSVTRHVADSDQPVEVVRYLHINRDVLARLNKLPPEQVARELGRIEARLEAPASPPVRKVSNAPPPVKPVLGTGNVTPSDEDGLSDEEWWKRERERMVARRK